MSGLAAGGCCGGLAGGSPAAAPAGSDTGPDTLRRREVSTPPELGALFPAVCPGGVEPQVWFLTARSFAAWNFYFIVLV